MEDVSEQDAVADFLAQRRIAVAGVAHAGENTGTFILRRLRALGYEVFGVNPSGGEVDGTPLYAHLVDIPGGVDGVVVVTSPAAGEAVMRDCAEAGVRRAWFHDNTVFPGSASPEAVKVGSALGIRVIPGGCPMMHAQPDPGHRCMHWVLTKTGRLAA